MAMNLSLNGHLLGLTVELISWFFVKKKKKRLNSCPISGTRDKERYFSPLDAMLIHDKVNPFLLGSLSLVPTDTPVERETEWGLKFLVQGSNMMHRTTLTTDPPNLRSESDRKYDYLANTPPRSYLSLCLLTFVSFLSSEYPDHQLADHAIQAASTQLFHRLESGIQAHRGKRC